MARYINADKFLDKLLYMGYMDEQKSEVEEVANNMIEEAIPKADYETRLKADMVAMLTELKSEMNPIKECEQQIYGKECWNFVRKCQNVIQQKINVLKESVEESRPEVLYDKALASMRKYAKRGRKMTNAKKCDICGKLYEPPICNDVVRIHLEFGYMGDRYVDLCDDCYGKLCDFVKPTLPENRRFERRRKWNT